jgi:hypothetical protein
VQEIKKLNCIVVHSGISAIGIWFLDIDWFLYWQKSELVAVLVNNLLGTVLVTLKYW